MNIWPSRPAASPIRAVFHDLLEAARRHPGASPADLDAAWAEVRTVISDPAEPAAAFAVGLNAIFAGSAVRT